MSVLRQNTNAMLAERDMSKEKTPKNRSPCGECQDAKARVRPFVRYILLTNEIVPQCVLVRNNPLLCAKCDKAGKVACPPHVPWSRKRSQRTPSTEGLPVPLVYVGYGLIFLEHRLIQSFVSAIRQSFANLHASPACFKFALCNDVGNRTHLQLYSSRYEFYARQLGGDGIQTSADFFSASRHGWKHVARTVRPLIKGEREELSI